MIPCLGHGCICDGVYVRLGTTYEARLLTTYCRYQSEWAWSVESLNLLFSRWGGVSGRTADDLLYSLAISDHMCWYEFPFPLFPFLLNKIFPSVVQEPERPEVMNERTC